MGIVINNVIGGVEVVFDADNKRSFPKDSSRLDFTNNTILLKDVDPQAGETVTLVASAVTTPSLGNNSLLHDAIRDMLYESEELSNIRQKMQEIAVNTFSGVLDTLEYFNDVVSVPEADTNFGDKTATPGEFYFGTLAITEQYIGNNLDSFEAYLANKFVSVLNDIATPAVGAQQAVYEYTDFLFTGLDIDNQNGGTGADEITYMVTFNGWKVTLV